jgi:hypothetical protein
MGIQTQVIYPWSGFVEDLSILKNVHLKNALTERPILVTVNDKNFADYESGITLGFMQ